MAKRKRLVLALGSALCFGPVKADFPAEFELVSLNGANGVVFNGINAADLTGDSVSAAGDVNNDGIDDLIIGAPFADPNGAFSGACYVVFGENQGYSSPFNLSTLNGSNGFVINGEALFDGACESVGAAGDVNGDGIDDLVIGAPDASPVVDFSGSTYVVFGTGLGFPNPLELSDINGSNGFVINGKAEGDSAGTSVNGAGDINGDGIDDLIIGTPFPGSGAGASYVVFGSNLALPSPLDLATLDGGNGFVINGVAAGDSSGNWVGPAGDINGDGIDDLIIGAPLAGPQGNNPGAAYVVFGSDQPWSSSLALADLDGSNGFVINGENLGDEAGTSVGTVGDINADGIEDVIVGAPKADANGASSGASYVVFGSDQAWSAAFSVSELNGSNGFAINGANAGDEAGTSVRAAGKVNADGIDDLVIGAPHADPKGTSSGESHVVFGSDQAWSSPLNLFALNGSNGFTLNGVAADDRSGMAVGAAGDVNGDGRTDLLIGAPGDPLGSSIGFSYLIFGGAGIESDLIFANGFE